MHPASSNSAPCRMKRPSTKAAFRIPVFAPLLPLHSPCTTNRSFSPPHRSPRLMRASMPAQTYSVAPMMDVTDRHFRALARLISRHATLYTEMVVDRTLIHNAPLRDLHLNIPPTPSQSPLVLQLGGSDPAELEAAARIAATYGYDQLNLNCGCPSPKVAGKGCFGAALMRSPHVVAEATRRMAGVLPPGVEVTVKCRLGVDDDDSYELLYRFVRIVYQEGGVTHFIVHARKAILGGLSPAQNRSIPPLRYDFVYRLIADFPHLKFSINGGLCSVEDVQKQLQHGVHGVMVGRAVMNKPWHALCDVDNVVYGHAFVDGAGPCNTRRRVLNAYEEYAEREVRETGVPVRVIIKPLLNLFHGEKNGKRFRRAIDEGLREKGASVGGILARACSVIPVEVLDAPPPSLIPKEEEGESHGAAVLTACMERMDGQRKIACDGME